MNTTCLTLIGIGSGTALGAAVISANGDQQASPNIATMIFPRGTRRAAVEARLDNEISSLETDPNIKDLVNTLEASISDLSDVKKQRPLNKDEKECLSKLERLKALKAKERRWPTYRAIRFGGFWPTY